MDPGVVEPSVSPDPIEQRRYERMIQNICERTGLSAEDARFAAVSVLCVLGQRLSGGEWLKVMGDFPEPIRPAIQGCGKHPNANPEAFGRDEFLRRVRDHLGRGQEEVEKIARAVFHEAIAALSPKDDKAVESQLPADLLAWWREEESAPGIPKPLH